MTTKDYFYIQEPDNFMIVKMKEKGQLSSCFQKEGRIEFFHSQEGEAYFSYYSDEPKNNIYAPRKFYLMEIKSQPGSYSGDDDYIRELLCSSKGIYSLNDNVFLTRTREGHPVLYDRLKAKELDLVKTFLEEVERSCYGSNLNAWSREMSIEVSAGKEDIRDKKLYVTFAFPDQERLHGVMSLEEKCALNFYPFVYSEKQERFYPITEEEKLIDWYQYRYYLARSQLVKDSMEHTNENEKREEQAKVYVKEYCQNKYGQGK